MNSLTELPWDIQQILLQFLTEQCPISFIMLSHVNKSYHLLTTNLVFKCKLPIKRQVECHEIASKGYLSVLKWAHSLKYKWNAQTCINAAHHGHLDVLKWARSKKCKWSNEVCSQAALNGHLHIIKWAKLNGCIMGKDTLENAAQRGNLNILKWAHKNK